MPKLRPPHPSTTRWPFDCRPITSSVWTYAAIATEPIWLRRESRMLRRPASRSRHRPSRPLMSKSWRRIPRESRVSRSRGADRQEHSGRSVCDLLDRNTVLWNAANPGSMGNPPYVLLPLPSMRWKTPRQRFLISRCLPTPVVSAVLRRRFQGASTLGNEHRRSRSNQNL